MRLKELLNQQPSPKIGYELSPKALEKWNPAINAAQTSDNTITIFDVIGEDYYGEGVTAKRIAAALRSIGDGKNVTVLLNSPGGSLFEGIAIYSLLKEYQGTVTVKILGMAASAASVIALAGDEVQISRSAFFMIHNAWVVAAGNRNDMRAVADYLEPFDNAMADLYSAETGISIDQIKTMLDAETWLGGTEAIEKGFADGYLDSDIVEGEGQNEMYAAHKLDIALAKAGIPRSERRKLVKEFKASTQTAASSVTQNADIKLEVEPLPRLTFPL